MSHPTTQPATSGSIITLPEIADALCTSRAVAFRLEDECPFGWEERLVLAAEIRRLIEEAPAGFLLLDTARAVEFRLASELYTFDDWEDRLHTANLVHSITAGLYAMQQQHAAQRAA